MLQGMSYKYGIEDANSIGLLIKVVLILSC
jgi:hypothetical protein